MEEYSNAEMRAIGSPSSEGTDLEKTLEDIHMICDNQRCALQGALHKFRMMIDKEVEKRMTRARYDEPVQKKICDRAMKAIGEKVSDFNAEILAIGYHEDRLSQGAHLHYQE